MSEAIRVAVWIPPSGDAIDAINKLMRKARETFDGPVFKPHLTLLSGIETTTADAQAKLRKLALAVPPVTIELGRIDWREEYFRALFIAATPNPELAVAKAAAHEIFEMNPPEPFEPHVSLAYGKLDEAAREAFVQSAGSLDIFFRAEKLQLVTAARGIPTSEWQVLAEHALEPATLENRA